jgi:hypothetical protein
LSTNISTGEESVSTDQAEAGIFRISDLTVGDSWGSWDWDAKSNRPELEVGNAADTSSSGKFVGATVLVHLLACIVGEDKARITAQTKTTVLVGAIGDRCI